MTDFSEIVDATGIRTKDRADDAVADTEVLDVLNRSYGLAGALERIMTEKDDTFRLVSSDGPFLVKVASSAERPELVDLQLAAMDHVASVAPDIPVQRVVRTLAGQTVVPLATGGVMRTLRVLTYLPGTLLAASEPTPALMDSVGRMLGRITAALADFAHPEDSRLLMWDLKHLVVMRGMLDYVTDPENHRLARVALDRFTADVVPLFPTLPIQVVHYDFSLFNLLVGGEDAEEIVGVLDFGDVVRTPLIFDLAVPTSNMLGRDPLDPWRHAEQIVAGYAAEIELDPAHLTGLADSATARLALRATVTDWQAHQSSSRHEYMLGHARDDWACLRAALDQPVRWGR